MSSKISAPKAEGAGPEPGGEPGAPRGGPRAPGAGPGAPGGGPRASGGATGELGNVKVYYNTQYLYKQKPNHLRRTLMPICASPPCAIPCEGLDELKKFNPPCGPTVSTGRYNIGLPTGRYGTTNCLVRFA